MTRVQRFLSPIPFAQPPIVEFLESDDILSALCWFPTFFTTVLPIEGFFLFCGPGGCHAKYGPRATHCIFIC